MFFISTKQQINEPTTNYPKPIFLKIHDLGIVGYNM